MAGPRDGRAGAAARAASSAWALRWASAAFRAWSAAMSWARSPFTLLRVACWAEIAASMADFWEARLEAAVLALSALADSLDFWASRSWRAARSSSRVE